MIIRNKVRIIRYSLGIIILVFAIIIGIILDNFILLFGNINGIKILFLLILVFALVFSIGLSAILIGRCEIFLDENYPKRRNK